ncbi:MAG: YceI family protein [Candidatus Limnocylindrales bacterium]|nr:YceI family protein [Candidatus Limnocylindrales bacterium]
MTEWTLDTAHANVEFSVKHMMISTIRGRFQKLEVDVDFDEQAPERSSVVARIATASVTTNQERRDTHLKSADFFDVETYPEMLFNSTSIAKVSDRDFKISGDLTIKDQTHPIVLDAELLGTVAGMQGGRVTAVSADTRINRKDWGITWNVGLESGGWLVGDEIRIHIEFELVAPALELAAATA